MVSRNMEAGCRPRNNGSMDQPLRYAPGSLACRQQNPHDSNQDFTERSGRFSSAPEYLLN
jgi:hypothetical protein